MLCCVCLLALISMPIHPYIHPCLSVCGRCCWCCLCYEVCSGRSGKICCLTSSSRSRWLWSQCPGSSGLCSSLKYDSCWLLEGLKVSLCHLCFVLVCLLVWGNFIAKDATISNMCLQFFYLKMVDPYRWDPLNLPIIHSTFLLSD